MIFICSFSSNNCNKITIKYQLIILWHINRQRIEMLSRGNRKNTIDSDQSRWMRTDDTQYDMIRHVSRMIIYSSSSDLQSYLAPDFLSYTFSVVDIQVKVKFSSYFVIISVGRIRNANTKRWTSCRDVMDCSILIFIDRIIIMCFKWSFITVSLTVYNFHSIKFRVFSRKFTTILFSVIETCRL